MNVELETGMPRLAGGEVLITWPDYEADGVGAGADLRAAGMNLRLAPKYGRRSAREMPALLDGVCAAIVSTDPFDAEILAGCPSLRVIARVGVGIDSIDLTAATRHGVAVTITPGANEETVADHTIALMLAAIRRVCEHDLEVRRGGWPRTGGHTPWRLSGSVVGLVGYGRIGRLVGRRLEGFDARVVVSDPAAPDTETIGLDALLEISDVVSLHVPLTEGTRNLIGARELDLMRPGSILVNTARGGVIDEEALHAALLERRIRAAALDVFGEEPPRSSELLSLSNVVLSPHNAGLSVASIDEMTRRATASVLDVLAGRRPPALANPEVLGGAGAAAALDGRAG